MQKDMRIGVPCLIHNQQSFHDKPDAPKKATVLVKLPVSKFTSC